ncbi:hypothetical protein [Bacillus halotolerans]|uniref:Uncharacterized protein n=1 Tax=Bacillus halotolerans TaxID=260554 RepID=A0A9Q4HWC1_9BACI|nr:hypothetical protein [Bacillus halotolerans]MCY9186654.1 hypothetical protein [Bacillus halotolerans]
MPYKLPTVKAPRPQAPVNQRKNLNMDSKTFNQMKSAGVLTIDEVRQQYGLPPVTDGHKLFKN